jgi:hypothetical protein
MKMDSKHSSLRKSQKKKKPLQTDPEVEYYTQAPQPTPNTEMSLDEQKNFNLQKDLIAL